MIEHSRILAPIVALAAWSLVMLVWLMVVRMPALKQAGIDIGSSVGGRPGVLDGVVPDKAQWPAHNYIHLMEQPTLFYAVSLVLAIGGWGDGLNADIAWGYVLLRIAHSVVQATVNRVSLRFPLFVLSTLCLVALTVHAGMAVALG